MPKYIVGQTYKAIWQDGTKKSFEIVEQGHGVYSDLYSIIWEDGYKEIVYKSDMERWVEKVQEDKQEEYNPQIVGQELEAIERLKNLRDSYLSDVKALDFAIAKLEKRP
ncbi:MAG: hypothetical protein ACK5JH_00775 [Anaerocolumna sp.]